MNIQDVLSKLERVRRAGKGWSARCPAHEDEHNSLSIGLGDDDCVLLHCFAGCPFEGIVRAMGIAAGDLGPEGGVRFWATPDNVTVAAIASHKQLPVEFLHALGLEDRSDGVFIPYFEPDGSAAPRNRLRTGISAKDNCLWTFGTGKPIPYGLDFLEQKRDSRLLVLVEGESDLWTLRFHGIPSLGIPGATMSHVLQAAHLRDIDQIFAVQEPGKGGEAFVSGIRTRLGTIRWKGELFTFTCAGFKDPSELHCDDPAAFASRFNTAMDAASPTQTVETTAQTKKKGTQATIAGLKAGSAAELDASLRELAESLSGADDLQRSVARETAIQQLRAQGIRSAAKLVDAALKVDDDGREGESSFLSDPTPSSDPVSGEELLDRLRDVLTRYVVLRPGADVAITLWIVFTYCLDAFSIAPILAILSPVKRCGKTTLLGLLRALVPRALSASNITAAAVFRSIEHYKPTLLIDEADTFISGNEELRGVINSGHTRGTAMVIRTVGDDHEPKVFSTWCAKAIALIGRLSDTLGDRSITISMRRKSPGETVDRLRQDRLAPELGELQSMIARWASDNLDDLRESDPEVPRELHDRAQDNWRPLLAIADQVGGQWPQLARETALNLEAAANESDAAPPIQLLEDIRSIFRDRNECFLGSEEIVTALTSLEDRPWAEWKQGKPLSKQQLSRLLRKFEIRPAQTHRRGEKLRGYELSQFADCFARYLPPVSGQSGQVNAINDLDAIPSRDGVGTVPTRIGTGAQQEGSCPDSESGCPESIPTPVPAESGQLRWGDERDQGQEEFDV